MHLCGVDGCSFGWIAVEKHLAQGKVDVALFKSASELFSRLPQPDLIAIDIPIGLSDDGPRACDQLARSRLDRRKSSIFPAPIRAILDEKSYEAACAHSFRRVGKKISKQTWAILAKIRSVDECLRQDRRLLERVSEVHPELSFAALNNKVPMAYPKKTRPGRHERRQLVDSYFGMGTFETLRAQVKTRDAAEDDLLDALAALWTAERLAGGQVETVPSTAPVDSRGIPMKIAF